MDRDKTNARTPKILLVDDNEMNRSLAHLMLEKANSTCDMVASGGEAVKKLSEENYDIVFMDCQMPGMDGFQATEAIRKLSKKKQPYIIAMTANPLNGDLDRYLSAGMDDYLSKPINYNELELMIEKYGTNCIFGDEGSDDMADSWFGMDFMEEGIKEFKEKNGFDDEIAGKLYNDYVNQIPKMVSLMEAALAESNLAELARIAHQLKGSSGMLRIKKMADICLALEMAGKKEDKVESSEIIEKIKWLYDL